MENAVMPTAVELRRWAANYPELRDRAAILTAQLAIAKRYPTRAVLGAVADNVKLLTGRG
jgi:hypothetical protein